jgi:hypothetical protein
MKRQHLTAYITLIALATLMLAAAPLRAETPAAAPPLRSAGRRLRHRRGGDDFIERLLVNKTLNANPRINEARARVPKQGLKHQ